MNKPTVLLLAGVLLGGCASATGSPPTTAPVVTSSPAIQPAGSSAPVAITSPTPSAGCATVGPDDAPDLVLHTAAGTERSGLDSTVPGSESDAWHQPAPGSALVVGHGERLTLGGVADIPAPLCLVSISVDAAPFAASAAQPIQAMIQPLQTDPIGADATSATVAAPATDGEWIVRVVAGLRGTDGSNRLERRFWRLRIGVDAPAAKGRSSRAGTCAQPGDNAPVAVLSTDATGATTATGQPGSMTWRGTSADAGDEPSGTRVETTPSSRMTIAIQGSVCAAGWRIVLAPQPAVRGGYPLPVEPFADLIAPRAATDTTSPTSADTFSVGALPAGAWIVRASFDFTDASGGLVGQTTAYWNVIVR